MKLEYRETFNTETKDNSAKTVTEVVRKELEIFLTKYPYKKDGYSELSDLLNVTNRTIMRYATGKHEPSPNALFNLFRVFYGHVTSKEEFELVVPNIVLDRIKNHPNYQNISFIDITVDEWFETQMLKRQSFRQIYLKARVSSEERPLTKNWAIYRFGKVGEEDISNMLKRGLLTESGEFLEINKNRVPNWSGNLLTEVTKDLIANNLDASKTKYDGQNAVGLYRKALNKDAYVEVQRKLQKFYSELTDFMELPESQGDKETFVALVMDQEKTV